MNLKARAKQLKADLPAVFLALKDRETPALAKVCAAVTVMYALSPVDLVPDFIPVLGCLDDVLLLPGLVALTIRLIPKQVWTRSREAAEGLWADGRPKKWRYALPIVAVWGLLVFLIVKVIWQRCGR